MELEEEAKKKSAFVVRGGLYSWKVMPFGLCNAPSTFERLMERVLRGLHWEVLFVYLDDVIVFAKTIADELARLGMVFQRFRQAGRSEVEAQEMPLVSGECSVFGTFGVWGRHLDRPGKDPSGEGLASPYKCQGSPEFLRTRFLLPKVYRRIRQHCPPITLANQERPDILLDRRV